MPIGEEPPIPMPPSSQPPPPLPSDNFSMFTAEDIAQLDEDVQKTVHRILARTQAFHDRKKGITHPSSPTYPGVEIARRFKEAVKKGLWPLSEEERQQWKQSEEEHAADRKEWEVLFDTHLNQKCDDDESDLECSSPDRDDADLVKRRRLVTPLPDMAPKTDRCA